MTRGDSRDWGRPGETLETGRNQERLKRLGETRGDSRYWVRPCEALERLKRLGETRGDSRDWGRLGRL